MALTKVSGDFIQSGSITQGHLHTNHGITTTHIAEGDKLFFTNARVDARVQGSLSTSDLSEGTNLYYTQARFNTAFAAKSTSDLSEGTNLYFTNARADARIALQVGSNLDLSSKSTSDLSEGTNLYYTDARVGSYLTTNSYATQSYVNTQVSNLVDSAPSTLDTLNELAAALGDDANFSTTVTNSIATKMPLAGGTFTGQVNFSVAPFLTQGVDLVFQAASGSTDPGDLVWRDGSNNERHRIWDGTNTLNYRTAGGTTYQLIHSGYSSYNNSNWDTAYGWGNHASAGYLASSSYTAADVLAKILTVDGPGSGLNADLLDGIGGDGYLRSNAADTLSATITLDNNGYFVGSPSYGFRFNNSGDTINALIVDNSGNSIAYLSHRAPIFYDSGNTNYYVNPDSTTSLRTVGSWRSDSSTWDGEFNGKIQHHGNYWYLQSANGVLVRNSSGANNINLSGAGIGTASNDWRAPQFYDSANTAYIVDPNGSSAIHDISMHSATATHFGIANTSGSTRDGIALYGGATGGEPTYGLLFTETSGFGGHGGVTGNWATYFTMNNDTNRGWIFRRVGVGNNASITAGGLATFDNSVRSPIFYDSNDTARYVDPNSLSRLNSLEIANTSNKDTPGALMKIGSDGFIFGGNNSGYEINSAQISAGYHMADSLNFVGMGTGSGNRRMDFWAEGGFFVRGNIYDKDSTGYYMDFSGTSNLAKVIFNTSSTGLPRQITIKEDGDTENSMGSYPGAWTSALNIQSNDGSTYLWFSPLTSQIPRIQTNYGQLDFYTGNNTNRALHLSGTSARSEVFYDLNNTGYYVNPASDSVFGGDLDMAAGGIGSTADGGSSANVVSRILIPQGGAGSWDSGQTGAIKIRLPIRANNNMWTMKVRIYNYNTNQSEEYFLGNYSYSNGGYNSQVAFHGGESSAPKNVRFGNDGTYDCVWIGETNSSWSYPVVSVLDFQAGFRSASTAANVDNYDVSIVTSFGTVQTTISPNTKAGSIVYAQQSFRAPIFYDSDDTNSYFNSGELILRDTDPTIYFRDTDHNSAMIHVNSNIFYVLRGANDTTSWTTVNGYWPLEINLTNNQATFGGIVQAITDMRAPVYYDRNDTTYYVDPNSTSRSGLFRSYLTFNDYGAGICGSYSSYRYQLVFAMGESYKGALDGTSVSGGYGLWWSHPNAGGVAANLNSHGLMNIDNGNWQASFAGSTRAAIDMRAPIFYDLNDTSYYTDPASTSDVKMLRTGKNHSVNAVRWDTSFYVAQSQHYYAHSSTQTMYIGESNFINIRSTADIHGDARSPIYYDRANTAYYTRPASSSNMYSIYTASFIQVGASGYSNLWLGGQSGNYFRFHTNNSHTYFDGNVGDIHWRQGSSTRFIFYMTTANMTVNGTVTQNSDERIKENIITIDSALNKVNQLRGVYYNRTDINTSQKQIGLIAQEVENVIPEVVLTANDELNTKSISYGQINALLIEAIKEQQTIIDDLKSRIETLENQ